MPAPVGGSSRSSDWVCCCWGRACCTDDSARRFWARIGRKREQQASRHETKKPASGMGNPRRCRVFVLHLKSIWCSLSRLLASPHCKVYLPAPLHLAHEV